MNTCPQAATQVSLTSLIRLFFLFLQFDDYHNDDAYDIMKLRLEQAEGLIAVPATETGR